MSYQPQPKSRPTRFAMALLTVLSMFRFSFVVSDSSVTVQVQPVLNPLAIERSVERLPQ